MGSGRWSDDDWTATKSLRAAAPREKLFVQQEKREADKAFDTRSILLRESVDSADNPNSTPIILGLDVTGSMGMIPEYFAKEGLGEMIRQIIDKQPIPDPHVMVMAVGDVKAGDRYPLQASQFEADNRISEQLVKLFLEGGGGGNESEGYDLPWLFAATRTKTDSFAKRGRKGYIFTFGDEPAPNFRYTAEELKSRIGGNYQGSVTTQEILEMARKEWVVFHIIVEQGSRGRDRRTYSSWKELLGPNALRCNDYTHLAELVSATIKANEGVDMDTILVEAGAGRSAVEYSFRMLQEEV